MCQRKDICPTSKAVASYTQTHDPTSSKMKREQSLEILARVGVILCGALLRNLKAQPTSANVFAVGMDVEVLHNDRFHAAKVVEVHKGPKVYTVVISVTQRRRGRGQAAAGPEERLEGVVANNMRMAGDAHSVYNLMLQHRTFERLSTWQHAAKSGDSDAFLSSELRWLEVHAESYRQAMREGARANAFEILSLLVACYDTVNSVRALLHCMQNMHRCDF